MTDEIARSDDGISLHEEDPLKLDIPMTAALTGVNPTSSSRPSHMGEGTGNPLRQ